MDERALSAHAFRQGGVVTVREAMALGFSREQVRYLARERGWLRPCYGVVAPPGVQGSPQMLYLRGVQRRAPYLVASHRTAARLLGIELLRRPGEPGPRDEVLELTDPRPERSGRALRGVRVHRQPLVAGGLPVVVCGVRVTGVAQTLRDLLHSEPRNTSVAALDSALRRRLISLSAMAARLEADGRRGRREAWRAFGLADPRSGSVAETEGRLLMHDDGLYPLSQAPVGSRRLDFLFRTEGLGVEIDGAETHLTRRGQARDLRRFNELAGCQELRAVLRFTWEDVFVRPAAMLAVIRRHLERLRRVEG